MCKRKVLLKLGGWFFVALGVIVLTISCVVYRHTRSFVQSAIRTKATLIKIVEIPGTTPNKTYDFVSSYYDLKGQEFTIDSERSPYKVGETFPVLYEKERPYVMSPDNFLDIWFWVVLLIGFGVFDLVIGFILLAVVGKIQRAKDAPSTIPAT